MTQAAPKIRLFIAEPFAAGGTLLLSANQSHYLAQVMREREGDAVAVFNGEDGEWRAEISSVAKKSVTLTLDKPLAPQKNSPDVWLAFAPIKQHTERLVEKAVELGVSKLLAVMTRHAVVKSVNEEKLMAHAIEAAEQCGRHDVPKLEVYKDLGVLLAAWPQDRALLHADETGSGKPMKDILPQKKYGIVTGPEGGFSSEEIRALAVAGAKAFGMGPRILRADTAAIAALACAQCFGGDWDERPRFSS